MIASDLPGRLPADGRLRSAWILQDCCGDDLLTAEAPRLLGNPLPAACPVVEATCEAPAALV
jgi:hypothetical protein